MKTCIACVKPADDLLTFRSELWCPRCLRWRPPADLTQAERSVLKNELGVEC